MPQNIFYLMTSPYERNILDLDVKQQITNQPTVKTIKNINRYCTIFYINNIVMLLLHIYFHDVNIYIRLSGTKNSKQTKKQTNKQMYIRIINHHKKQTYMQNFLKLDFTPQCTESILFSTESIVVFWNLFQVSSWSVHNFMIFKRSLHYDFFILQINDHVQFAIKQ